MLQGRPVVLIQTPLWKFITRKDQQMGSTVDFYQIYCNHVSSLMALQSHAKKIMDNWNIHKYVSNKILWSRNTQKYLVILQRSWRIHVIQNINAFIETLAFRKLRKFLSLTWHSLSSKQAPNFRLWQRWRQVGKEKSDTESPESRWQRCLVTLLCLIALHIFILCDIIWLKITAIFSISGFLSAMGRLQIGHLLTGSISSSVSVE